MVTPENPPLRAVCARFPATPEPVEFNIYSYIAPHRYSIHGRVISGSLFWKGHYKFNWTTCKVDNKVVPNLSFSFIYFYASFGLTTNVDRPMFRFWADPSDSLTSISVVLHLACLNKLCVRAVFSSSWCSSKHVPGLGILELLQSSSPTKLNFWALNGGSYRFINEAK